MVSKTINDTIISFIVMVISLLYSIMQFILLT